MDTETDCFDEITLLETNSLREQVKVKTGTTIPAYPATGILPFKLRSFNFGGQYVLPQAGNSLLLPPTEGKIVDIISIAHATANDTVLTVRRGPMFPVHLYCL